MVWEPTDAAPPIPPVPGPPQLASYLVANAVDIPINGRVLIQGTGLIFTDNGPGLTFVIDVDTTVIATKVYVDAGDAATLAAANAYTDAQIAGLGATYATKASLTGIGYLKGTGVYPPSFVPSIPISDLGNPGGNIGDLITWDGVNWIRLPDVAVGSALVSGGVGVVPNYSTSPTLTGLTLTGLTASRYVVTNGAKLLISQTGIPLADLGNTGGATGDLITWNGANWVRLADVAVNQVLVSGGVGVAPSYSGSPTLTGATFTGLTASRYVVTDGAKALTSQQGVPLADLGNAGGANGDVMYYNGTNWIRLAIGTTGKALTVVGGIPAWGTDFGANDLTTTGNLLIGGGTLATAGLIRTANNKDVVMSRNAANTANIGIIGTDASNNLFFGRAAAGGSRGANNFYDVNTAHNFQVAGLQVFTISSTTLNLGINATTIDLQPSGTSKFKVNTTGVGFFATAPVAQQVSGANLTNNVTAGGTNDQIDNYNDLVTYANDAAAIRNNIYQLARKLKQVNDGLRAYGILT